MVAKCTLFCLISSLKSHQNDIEAVLKVTLGGLAHSQLPLWHRMVKFKFSRKRTQHTLNVSSLAVRPFFSATGAYSSIWISAVLKFGLPGILPNKLSNVPQESHKLKLETHTCVIL